MAVWKYRLEFEGKLLRELLHKEEETIENIIAIYNQLIICLEKLKRRLLKSDKEDWEYEIENMIEDLQCACPDVKDDSLDYKDEQENLNYYLRDFYDMCDSVRVWVGV